MNRKNGGWMIFCIVILGIAIHLLPFLLYGKNPLGYDTGFYRRYLIDYAHALQNVPGLGSGVFFPKITYDILHFLHFPVNVILYGTMIALYAAVTVTLYFLIREYASQRVALLAALLFTLSPIQYFGYWAMLYKNIYGLFFLLLTALWMRKRSPWMYAGAAAIALTHETTAIIFLISLGVFWVMNANRRKETALLFCLTAGILVSIHYSDIGQNILNLPQASFASWTDYIGLSIPLLLLAFAGARSFLRETKGEFLLAFAIASVAYPLFFLPFYQRIFIFSDLSVIVMAAYGADYFIRAVYSADTVFRKRLFTGVIGVFAVFIVCLLASKVEYLRPMLDEPVMAQLNQLDSLVPKGAYLLTESQLAPWTEGWGHAHVIAPGLLYDVHNESQWSAFFAETDAKSKLFFLDDFGKPLYFFLPPSDRMQYVPDTCAERMTDYIYKYTCG